MILKVLKNAHKYALFFFFQCPKPYTKELKTIKLPAEPLC